MFHILAMYHSREIGSLFDDFFNCINKNVVFFLNGIGLQNSTHQGKKNLKCAEAEEFGW